MSLTTASSVGWAWLRRHLWVWQYNVIYQEVYFVEKNHCQGIKSMAYRQTIWWAPVQMFFWSWPPPISSSTPCWGGSSPDLEVLRPCSKLVWDCLWSGPALSCSWSISGSSSLISCCRVASLSIRACIWSWKEGQVVMIQKVIQKIREK